MKQAFKNELLCLSSVVSVVSLGISYCYHHLLTVLRIINSDPSYWKKKAHPPNRMVVNSGKSINHSHFNSLTLKHYTRTLIECTSTK